MSAQSSDEAWAELPFYFMRVSHCEQINIQTAMIIARIGRPVTTRGLCVLIAGIRAFANWRLAEREDAVDLVAQINEAYSRGQGVVARHRVGFRQAEIG